VIKSNNPHLGGGEQSGWPPMSTWVCPNIGYSGVPNQNPSQQIWKEKSGDYLKLTLETLTVDLLSFIVQIHIHPSSIDAVVKTLSRHSCN